MTNNFDVSVKMTGYNRVRNQLRAMASAHTKETDPVIGKHAKTQSAMLRQKPYPAMLPNQKYVRTFELKRKFRARKRAPGQWEVNNKRKGAARVIKKGMQNKAYHLGRWWTIEDTLAETMPTLTENLSVMLEDLMRKQKD